MKYVHKYITIKAWDSVVGWIEKDTMARVYGHYLAVHSRFDDSSIFNITHVPTGFCLSNDFDSEKEAIIVLKAMLEGYDWNFTSVDQSPVGAMKFFARKVKEVTGKEPKYHGITNAKALEKARPAK